MEISCPAGPERADSVVAGWGRDIGPGEFSRKITPSNGRARQKAIKPFLRAALLSGSGREKLGTKSEPVERKAG